LIVHSELPTLHDVTLVAVTSVAVEATVNAIVASIEQVNFAEALLLSDRKPTSLDCRIAWRPIEQLSSRAEYSNFMLRKLADHIQTSHALCIQWDGFVIDGTAWQSAFLDYDYIGAPWPHFRDAYNVGNGGFSLRSRKLLCACANMPLDGESPEDVVISRVWRPQLEEMGIRFAPESLARQFAYERMSPSGKEFGFHGVYNLVSQVRTREATRILASLEPEMLARNERWEILRWALRSGKLIAALNMVGRLV